MQCFSATDAAAFMTCATAHVSCQAICSHATAVSPCVQVAKQNGKRRGPLPLFLGQFLVLAAYGGAGFLAFQKDEETRKAIAFMIGLAQKGYNKVQGLLPSSNNA